MTKRRRGHKRRGPGEYKNPDGSITTVEYLPDGRIKETRVTAPGTGRAVRSTAIMRPETLDQVEARPMERLANGAPAVRTNAIPGEPSRITYDPLTGESFADRKQYDSFLKQNGWVDAKPGEIRKPPSYAELPRHIPGVYTHGIIKPARCVGEDKDGIPIMEEIPQTPAQRDYEQSHKHQQRRKRAKERIKREVREARRR